MQDSFLSLSSPVCSDLSLLINIFWLSCLCYSVTSVTTKTRLEAYHKCKGIFKNCYFHLLLLTPEKAVYTVKVIEMPYDRQILRIGLLK